MPRHPAQWISPLVAAGVLVVIVGMTLGALRVTGAFGWHATAHPPRMAPAFAALDRALDRHDPRFTLAGLRDPFAYGSSSEPVTAAARTAAPHTPAPRPAPVPAQPIITAIVWDNDPRALVRWADREWTVREGGLFDEFQVVSITRDQVLLRHGDATLVLRRRNPGD